MRRHWLKIAVWSSSILVTAVYLCQLVLGESSWLVCLTMFLPPFLWVAPSFILFFVAIAKGSTKLAAVAIHSAVFGLFLLGGFCRGHDRDVEPLVKVMTFNVEKFTDHTPAEVAEVIRKENPDVVCLQEASKLPQPWRPPTELAKLLPDYKLVSEGELAILTRLELVKKEAVPLSAGPPSRPALIARLKARGKEVAVVYVHLQFFPWDDFSIGNIERMSRDRELQEKDLERLIDKESGPIAICGDLNSPPISPIPRMLSERLIDTYARTHFGFGWTIPSGFPNRRFDYVFAGHGLEPARSEVVGKVASDHRPLVAVLGIR